MKNISLKVKQMFVVVSAITIIGFISIACHQNPNHANMKMMSHNNQMMSEAHQQGVMDSSTSTVASNGPWVAPASADKVTNPVEKNKKSIALGKSIFQSQCFICHGEKGKGDGMAGAALNPKPSNLTTTEFNKQTDGAIFWKITTGRAPMPSFKETLTEQQRWELVNYIRTFNK